jgi:hypothetical protein
VLVRVIVIVTVVAGMLVEWVLTLMAACFDQLLRGLAFGVPELRRGDWLELPCW